MLLQTIQDMLKQAKAGRMVSEDDIPPAVTMLASRSAVSDWPSASAQVPAEPHAAATRQTTVEIPRPAVIGVGGQAAAMPPVAQPRSSVQSPMQQPAGSGLVSTTSINVAQAAVNAPPVQLHTGPASAHRPVDTGGLYCF